MSGQADPRTVTEVGGALVDVDTGEIVGVARMDETDPQEPFRVRDQDSAEWVLERILEAESEADALGRRKALIVDNLDRMQREHTRRAEFFRERFGPQLEEWARGQLNGKKARTLRTPYGSLAFRKKAARLVIEDEEQAIADCLDNAPDAVKTTYRLLVSMLPAGVVPKGCRVEPGGDSFRIEVLPRADAKGS